MEPPYDLERMFADPSIMELSYVKDAHHDYHMLGRFRECYVAMALAVSTEQFDILGKLVEFIEGTLHDMRTECRNVRELLRAIDRRKTV
ncbi:hypothetical protein LCGC14_1600870, partial [marine sediment metagenome]